MLDQIVPWLADALVVLGVGIMTIGVYGAIRMPDLYTRLHAASKAVFLGVISLAAASVVTGQVEIIARVVLISALLLLTTPVASHAIGRAAYLEREMMETPGAIDESGQHLDRTLPAGARGRPAGRFDGPHAVRAARARQMPRLVGMEPRSDRSR